MEYLLTKVILSLSRKSKNGNKRTAFHTMLYFLELNGKEFKYEKKIEKMLNRIARKIEKRNEIEKWVEEGIKWEKNSKK
ncbi:MAG: type II toxin-antitoxin system death-on-curing family toxin [Candidatus Aenigmatarchaeota archaeon]